MHLFLFVLVFGLLAGHLFSHQKLAVNTLTDTHRCVFELPSLCLGSRPFLSPLLATPLLVLHANIFLARYLLLSQNFVHLSWYK